MLFKLSGIGRTVITAIIIYNKSIHVVTGICCGILKVFFLLAMFIWVACLLIQM